MCFCSYIWNTKYLARKSSLLFLSFMYIILESERKIWIQFYCVYIPPQRCKKPLKHSDLYIVRDLHSAWRHHVTSPHLCEMKVTHYFSHISWFDWKFLKAEMPMLHLCRKHCTMKWKFSFGHIKFSTMQINFFFIYLKKKIQSTSAWVLLEVWNMCKNSHF